MQNAFVYLTTLRNAKALIILSAVAYKMHLYLKMSLMMANNPNTLISLYGTQRYQIITILSKKTSVSYDEGQHTRCIY